MQPLQHQAQVASFCEGTLQLHEAARRPAAVQILQSTKLLQASILIKGELQQVRIRSKESAGWAQHISERLCVHQAHISA